LLTLKIEISLKKLLVLCADFGDTYRKEVLLALNENSNLKCTHQLLKMNARTKN
jgi:hypothetical protein